LRRDLPVGIELDAVRRVEIDALHLALERLTLSERGHHLQAVAEDHAVLPVHGVLVELGTCLEVGEPVEIGEHIGRVARRLTRFVAAALQLVDDCLGLHLFLHVEHRRIDHEVGPVLRVLAAPDELGISDLDCTGLQELRRLLLSERDPDAVPHDLRIEVRVPLTRSASRQRPRAGIMRRRVGIDLLLLLGERLQLRRRHVDAPRLLVLERVDPFG
jgi:hypothetical protein